jgi:hypothetical protein
MPDAQNSTRATPSAMLDKLSHAVDGTKPTSAEGPTIDADTLDFKERRVATKHYVLGLTNSIRQVIPEFTLEKAIPQESLRPCDSNTIRVALLPDELQVLGLRRDEQRYFRMNTLTGHREFDFYFDEGHYRLPLVGDEGSEAP